MNTNALNETVKRICEVTEITAKIENPRRWQLCIAPMMDGTDGGGFHLIHQ